MNINGSPEIGLIIVSFLGVLLIGLTNLFVSFTLTIIEVSLHMTIDFKQDILAPVASDFAAMDTFINEGKPQ